MCQTSMSKRWCWRFITGGVIHVMEILMIRLETSKKTCLERRGLQSLTQPVSVVVSCYPTGSVGMNEPSTLREWGVMAVVGPNKHKMPLKNKYGSNAAILNIVKMVRNAWNERVN